MMTYSGTNGSEAGQGPSPRRRGSRKANTSVWLAGVVAFVLLIGAGVAYQVAVAKLDRLRKDTIVLPVSLKTIPMRISPWTGHDVNLPTTTVDYIKANFADDLVSRRYANTAEGTLADVYVVYCSAYPSGILGHEPDNCFPANGWIHDSTAETEITTRSGRTIKCLSHQFHGRPPTYGQVFVLSFYLWNGQITRDEGDFSGIFHRAPNISRNPARYVAQVQISSAVKPSAEAAARDLVDTILTFLPDPNGVQAASSLGRTAAGQAADANR